MLTNLARILSFIFHPLFILFYLLVILIVVNPYLFSVQAYKDQVFLIVSIFMLSVMFPLISILMLKFVGFIDSFQMHDPKERIGPLIAALIFYLWLFINIKKMNIVPEAYQLFVLGSVIAMGVGFVINNFTKISLHGIGMGGLVAAILLIRYKLSYNSFSVQVFGSNFTIGIDLLTVMCIIFAGAVCTSRLYLKAHKRQDVYGGFLVGFVSQLIALRFIDI